MLQSIMIESFAIIEQVTIDFSNHMTVLSGETGAGKSIIIDALGILCGGRGSNEYIRQGSDKLVVEGMFSFDEVPLALIRTLDELGIDSSSLSADGLIIRREITQQGKNIIRVNGQLINVTALKRIGEHLVDIHGQNEHQALLDNTQHLALVDQLGDAEFEQLKADYQQAFEHYQTVRTKWQQSQKNEQEQLQRLSFLEFQVSEIEAANLSQDEYETLEQMSLRLQNAAKIAQGVSAINYLLSEHESSVLGNLNEVIGEMAQIQHYHDAFPALYEQLKSMRFDLQEVAHEIAMSGDFGEDDSQSIDEIEARLNELGQLKRKYGMEIDEIMAYYDQISEEIYQVKHREDYLKELSQEFNVVYQKAVVLAQQLHDARVVLAEQLVKAIEKELADLYMPHSRFDVQFQTVESQRFDLVEIGAVEFLQLNELGFDIAEFYAITNVGEASKPLVKVASGGELSRFMLALKAVFSRQSKERVMVFDEIDTGVSGRVAQAIAEKIAQIAQMNQVLCITHLAQVAAIAAQQLYIQKIVENNRTHTAVALVNLDERIEILANMISGKQITDSSRQLAKEMLAEMQAVKQSLDNLQLK
ncbi:DNA repair protein RecN [Aerococcaceae bacterium zg-ZJ1578]|uniref:DNA repair protein RecN n=1 Tax=Aerococcaceae bacterium zg-252 TaxID=2796928 RepID=UPI001A264F6B|nr:DNA repair protein RecN [Aerococcaceae bacterium zg-1578]